MANPFGRWRSVRPAGLTGYRYLLAVAVLLALTVLPVLVAVIAGYAELREPASPTVDPFATYLPADDGTVPPERPGAGVDGLTIDDPGDTGWWLPGGSRMLW